MTILTNEQCCERIGWKRFIPDSSISKIPHWKTSEGQEIILPPDFHNSLDACFKWLVSWLKEKGVVSEIITHPPFTNYQATFGTATIVTHQKIRGMTHPPP